MTGTKGAHLHIVNQSHIKKLAGSDPVIAMIYGKYGAPPNRSRPPGFVSLSKIILEQQVSLASGHAHFIKLNSYLDAFTPQQVLKLNDEEMRSCQVSRQKTKYLRCLSEAIVNKELDLEKLNGCSEEKIREALTRIKGIGNWTTDVYLLFCMQAKDVFPIGDIAVVNTIRELYGANSREEILSVAGQWAPNRSLATYFMWHYYLKKRKKRS